MSFLPNLSSLCEVQPTDVPFFNRKQPSNKASNKHYTVELPSVEIEDGTYNETLFGAGVMDLIQDNFFDPPIGAPRAMASFRKAPSLYEAIAPEKAVTTVYWWVAWERYVTKQLVGLNDVVTETVVTPKHLPSANFFKTLYNQERPKFGMVRTVHRTHTKLHISRTI
jgi:hypothetical protein